MDSIQDVQQIIQENKLPNHLYINRELSWLEFNQRVLEEATHNSNPLFEQIKFLAITASNLDEFFMVRFASIWDQVEASYTKPDSSGLTPIQQLDAISKRVLKMSDSMYAVLRDHIMPKLHAQGILITNPSALTSAQIQYVDEYFDTNVYPVLTPMAVDSMRPFPLILNKSLNLGLLLKKKKGEPSFATVQVPSGLSRLVRLPGSQSAQFIMLEDLIARNIHKLFKGRTVQACRAYRITRNADLSIDEEEANDLLIEIEKSLKQRRWGAAVRLEIDQEAEPRLIEILKNALELDPRDVYPVSGPLNLDFLTKDLYKLSGYDHLKYEPYTPKQLPFKEGQTLFDAIAEKDILLYHPYDSFDPVVHFVRSAAQDPKVLAIKQTLYRVSGDSPIVAALMEAAEGGKQVTVLLELKARFDEENNIHWGRRLERAGAHVIYGMLGLKTHSKITLVVREEEQGIQRYVHLSTGNYNDITANIYTDHGIFTSNGYIGRDASAFFNMLTGFTDPPNMKTLICAPRDMRKHFMLLINREIKNAEQGKKAEIFAKMNSLVDEGIILALYRASIAGVKIRLIVRGICCLRPGIDGVSDNIKVHSIVGRYLEHSRIFSFHNDGKREVYLSSADWMPRNLDRRVELLFPVNDLALADQLYKTMQLQWKDNTQSRHMLPNGLYEFAKPAEGEEALNAQAVFMQQTHSSTSLAADYASPSLQRKNR